jgi:hypothetical protein
MNRITPRCTPCKVTPGLLQIGIQRMDAGRYRKVNVKIDGKNI